MKIDVLEELASADEDRVLRVGEPDVCAIVDWRDGAKEVIDAVAEFLPPDFLSWEVVDSLTIRVCAEGRPSKEIRLENQKQEPFINDLNEVISPEFEIRQFRPCDGDGYSLLVRPTAWWREVTTQHPELIEQNFLTTERLAVFWNKSYFGRLFSKP